MAQKIDWKNHIVELIVVFIGITAAFMLNNWRDGQKDRELEQKYLNSFLEDVRADGENLGSMIPNVRTKLIRIGRFVKVDMPQERWPADSALAMLTLMMANHKFEQKRTTYESVKNSGNFEILADYDLRNELIEYYERNDEVKTKERIYFDWLEAFVIPFVYDNVDLANQKIVSENSIRGHIFRNLVVGYFVLLKQNIKTYESVQSLNDSLQTRLSHELGQQETAS